MAKLTTMAKRAVYLSLLLVLLVSALSSCGPRTLSLQAYQNLVIQTLQGGELEKGLSPLPGLIPSIKKFFDSLYCAEYNCGIASEMQYIVGVAQDEADLFSIYTSRICGKRARPPKELQNDQGRICDLLDGMRLDIEAIRMTAGLAASALAGQSDAGDAGGSSGFSKKIMERKGRLINSLQGLREVSLLAPVFAGIEDQIPEMGVP